MQSAQSYSYWRRTQSIRSGADPPSPPQLPGIPVELGNQADCLCVIEGDFLPHARGCYHQKSAYVDSERGETVAASGYVICFQSVWSVTEMRSGRKKADGKWL